jgi:transposase
MSTGFKPYDRNQLTLFPPVLEDWIPANDFCRFLVEALESLDLSDFNKDYKPGTGRKAYPPEILLGTLLYAYSLGMRSSRKIETACLSDVRFRYVSAGMMPDHSTLSRFRSKHEDQIVDFFSKTVRLAHEMGMKKMGTIAIDGTKIKANASLASNKTKDGLKEELKAIVEEASQQDEKENGQHGTHRGDELPDDLVDPKTRRGRIEECIHRLEKKEEAAKEAQAKKIKEREDDEENQGKKKRGRKPKQPDEVVNKDAKANVTDPESRIMKSSKGFVQGYNAQASVTEDQLIVAAELTQEENDMKQLVPMIEASQKNTDFVEEAVKNVLADTGYYNEEEINRLPEQSPELYLATKKDREQRADCVSDQSPKGRKPSDMTAKEQMDRKLLTKKGKTMYSQRGWMVEGTFGQMKHDLGFDRFMRRGKSACASEWKLMCSVHNLLKIFRFQSLAIA